MRRCQQFDFLTLLTQGVMYQILASGSAQIVIVIRECGMLSRFYLVLQMHPEVAVYGAIKGGISYLNRRLLNMLGKSTSIKPIYYLFHWFFYLTSSFL